MSPEKSSGSVSGELGQVPVCTTFRLRVNGGPDDAGSGDRVTMSKVNSGKHCRERRVSGGRQTCAVM